MFPKGKMKALTLSYDDGVEQDRPLVEILNRHGIRATFNLNSGIQSGANWKDRGGVISRRMNIASLPDVYEGHEIAVHSLTHPHLEELDADTLVNELAEDKGNLERIFGRPVVGMAYPFGTYNDTVKDVARRCGLRYGRGVVSTRTFETTGTKGDLLEFQPTVHHNDAGLLELAEAFVKVNPLRPQLFYLWGHSYEFDINRNWDLIKDFCSLVAGREDIFYGTNAEVLLG